MSLYFITIESTKKRKGIKMNVRQKKKIRRLPRNFDPKKCTPTESILYEQLQEVKTNMSAIRKSRNRYVCSSFMRRILY